MLTRLGGEHARPVYLCEGEGVQLRWHIAGTAGVAVDRPHTAHLPARLKEAHRASHTCLIEEWRTETGTVALLEIV